MTEQEIAILTLITISSLAGVAIGFVLSDMLCPCDDED